MRPLCPTPLDSSLRGNDGEGHENDGLRRDPKRYERTKLWIGLANLAVYILGPRGRSGLPAHRLPFEM